jgi:hypothetical protein
MDEVSQRSRGFGNPRKLLLRNGVMIRYHIGTSPALLRSAVATRTWAALSVSRDRLVFSLPRKEQQEC